MLLWSCFFFFLPDLRIVTEWRPRRASSVKLIFGGPEGTTHDLDPTRSSYREIIFW